MKKILLSLCLATTGMAYSQLITDGLFAYFPFDSTFSDQGPNHLTSHVDVPIYSADKNGTLNKVFVIDSLKNVFHINAQQQMKDLIKSPLVLVTSKIYNPLSHPSL